MKKRIMIVVTHLLGTGHLARALTLARAMARAGLDVHVVSGGFPVPHFDTTGVHLHQLPPLRSDGTDFTRLLTARGDVADKDYLTSREQQLCAVFSDLAPDILMTELFPFGRRNLRHEFLTLLKFANTSRTRPDILCSIRDILAPPSKPAKAEFADNMVDEFFDAVLVHSDPDLVPLDLSWPVSANLAEKVHYTGFVAAPLPQLQETTPGTGEIVVSAGGGQVGQTLFETCISAAKEDQRTWRLLLPGGADAPHWNNLRNAAPVNVILDQTRPDFREILQKAQASVSLCGYNTAMDLLQTGIPAVIVPFDDGGEVEQTLRARAFDPLQGIEAHTMSSLTPKGLVDALARVTQSGHRNTRVFNLGGTKETVRFCHERLT